VERTAQLDSYPAATDVASLIPRTATGACESVLVPSPKPPCALPPQQRTVRSESIAQVVSPEASPDDLQRAFKGRVVFRSGYDESLAHLIEAGSDMFLMPSRYEPCGLNQMYSLRYGTIPIVRKTGGLADSVRHFDPSTGQGTGCVFNDYDAPAVRWGVGTALDWFADQKAWRQLMLNAMAEDFSWRSQTLEYEQVYRDAAASADSSRA